VSEKHPFLFPGTFKPPGILLSRAGDEDFDGEQRDFLSRLERRGEWLWKAENIISRELRRLSRGN
jgi:hypothetical protein